MNNNIVLKKEVNSHSRPMTHAVTLAADGTWNCTCEHHKYRGAICKHILEVQDELETEGVVIAVETADNEIELVDVCEIPETTTEVKGVADTEGHVVSGVIGLGIEVERVCSVEDTDDNEDVGVPVLVGVPKMQVPTKSVGVEVNDAKALSQLKKALKLKEELLNLKENGVDVTECLEVVNDLILEI